MNRAQLLAELYPEGGTTLPYFSWPGGYPLYYLTKDISILCPACANGENGSMATDPECQDDPQWQIVAYDVHWEGLPLTCEHCNAQIESAYGDSEDTDDE